MEWERVDEFELAYISVSPPEAMVKYTPGHKSVVGATRVLYLWEQEYRQDEKFIPRLGSS